MTDEVAQPAKSSKFTPVTLEEPINRGENQVATITLRKPQAGELRGLTIEDIVGTDVNALIKLIPRISDPSLTEEEVAALDVIDIAQCAGAVRGFFMTKEQQARLTKMIEDL